MDSHQSEFEDSLEQARTLLATQEDADDLDEANLLVDHAICLRPYDGEAWLLKSQILAARGDDVAALAAVEMAVKLWPRAAEVQYWRAAVLADLERFEEALKTIHGAFRLLAPEDDGLIQELFYEKAMILESMGQRDDAMAILDEGLAHFPESGILQAGFEFVRRERVRASFKVLPGGLS